MLFDLLNQSGICTDVYALLHALNVMSSKLARDDLSSNIDSVQPMCQNVINIVLGSSNIPKSRTTNDFHRQTCQHVVHLNRLPRGVVCHAVLQVGGSRVHEGGMGLQHLGVKQRLTTGSDTRPKLVTAQIGH